MNDTHLTSELWSPFCTQYYYLLCTCCFATLFYIPPFFSIMDYICNGISECTTYTYYWLLAHLYRYRFN